jgi:hypothetical protein
MSLIFFALVFQFHQLRVETVSRFIAIAYELLNLNNLFSMGAILSGFSQTPLHRIRRIWDGKDVCSIFFVFVLNSLSFFPEGHRTEIRLHAIENVRAE